MRILITGGAGFVGSRLAALYKEADSRSVIYVLDNLHRRGSEINVPAFKERGIHFVHGDIRQPGDFSQLPGEFDIMIEASAEPSVLAGLTASPDYLIQTNLTGTINCLEFARRRAEMLVFLSTSRVYSIAPLRGVVLKEGKSRFELSARQRISGISTYGISEAFPTDTARSLYGATKLASEMMIQEYAHAYGMKAVINRCGVIAGAGQFGKTDQGVFTLWVANHIFQKPLTYTGFGGKGKQVRDLLHPRDLFELIQKQLARIRAVSGQIFNVGGGRDISTSLLELTAYCEAATGKRLVIASNKNTTPVDIPLYITDYSRAEKTFKWKPRIHVDQIVDEIARWITDNRRTLASIFN
jgi:CDP-paratose 2-epimerase